MNFVSPEGVWTNVEEYKPAPANLHPVSPNSPTHPTRLSTITVRFPVQKHANTPGFAQLLGGNKEAKKPLDGVSLSSSESPEDPPDVDGNFFTAGGKKKPASRPKHNIRTTSSTFISRLQSAEGLAKTLQSKQGDVTFLFYNSVKSFLWIEVGANAKEPLARVTFTAFPTCHDINPTTACSDRLDIIIGFNTGDLVWFDPMSSRYNRLNKAGCISASPCTAVRWVPTSTTLFLVSHADGTVIVYDKEREDGVFAPQDPTEWNPLDSVFVTVPPWLSGGLGGAAQAQVGKDNKAARNPVSHWRVSKRSVVDFLFSPDVKYVAVISEDGCLRLIDALEEQLVDCYASYFGSLTCVAWSHDGRFILTGGQDDLLTIFSPWEQRVVARCQGHSSFVSSVAFDDLRSDGRTYRFGSVGEDNKLILWDFSSGALHRPKQQHHPNRFSMAASTVSLAYRRGSGLNLPLHAAGTGTAAGADFEGAGGGGGLPKYHPAPSRNEVSVVQPVLVKHIESELMTAIAFLPRALLTAGKTGLVKMWVRPLAIRARMGGKGKVKGVSGVGFGFGGGGAEDGT